MTIFPIFAVMALVFVSVLIYPICAAKDISKAHKRVFSFVILAVFMVGSLALYSKLGAPEILPLLAQREEKLAVLKDKITVNSEAIKREPKNLKAWVELGDSFMETGQFSAAENAYKRSVLLSRGNPVLIMAYARAMIAGADGKVSDDAKKSLDMLLMLEPENEEARYYSAVWKLQNGKTQAAMQDMKALYKSLPDTSPIKAMIDKQIGRE